MGCIDHKVKCNEMIRVILSGEYCSDNDSLVRPTWDHTNYEGGGGLMDLNMTDVKSHVNKT